MHEPTATSVTTKLILFVFAATFGTALVVSAIAIHGTRAEIRAQLERAEPARVRLVARGVDQALSRVEDQLAELASREPLAGPPDVRREQLRGWLARIPELERLDGGGVSVTRPDPRAPGRGLPVSIPRSEAPPLAGVVRADRLLPWLEVAEAERGNARVVLVDGRGRPLLGADPWAGAVPDARVPWRNGARDGRLLEYRDPTGRPVLGASARVGERDLRVLLELPARWAFARLLATVNRIFLADLLVVLAVGWLAHRVSARRIDELRHLADGASRVGRGKLDSELPEGDADDELGVLTPAFNEMLRQLRANRQEIDETHAALARQNRELQDANEVLAQLSITDGLTKLHNHRHFQEHLTREIRRHERTLEPLSMMILDIDDFKRLNDRHGHAVGDEVLERIASILNRNIRETDFLARYGGEEFVVLAVATDLAGACSLAEKLRVAVAEATVIAQQGEVRIDDATVSVGVATYRGDRLHFFRAADQALYRAKAAGKDCVVAEEDDLVPPL